MWKRKHYNTVSVSVEDRSPFKPIEVASILFCMHLKFNEKRDMELIRVSRFASKTVIGLYGTIVAELFNIHLVGSRAEGINDPTSDTDQLVALRDILCCDAGYSGSESVDEKTVFLADSVNASPGYVQLWDGKRYISEEMHSWTPVKLNNMVHDRSLLAITNTKGEVKAVDSFGTMVFNNEELTNELLQLNMSRNGPALNLLSSFGDMSRFMLSVFGINLNPDINNMYTFIDKLHGKISLDQVYALPFRSDTILRTFISRRRRYSWPTKSLLNEIEGMPAYVVPVGRKGSRFEDKEWRISYTLTETHLIQSLNEVQLMLLYQLKIITKANLLPISPEISTYVIKNLFLWIVECCPAEYFKYENFIPLYKSFLVVLKKRISEGRLPNYMIPTRNLVEGKLGFLDKLRLQYRLRSLIKHGLDIIPLGEIYKAISRKEIHLLQEKLVKERNNSVLDFSTTAFSIRLCLLLLGFVSPRTLISSLMRYAEKLGARIPADIPLD